MRNLNSIRLWTGSRKIYKKFELEYESRCKVRPNCLLMQDVSFVRCYISYLHCLNYLRLRLSPTPSPSPSLSPSFSLFSSLAWSKQTKIIQKGKAQQTVGCLCLLIEKSPINLLYLAQTAIHWTKDDFQNRSSFFYFISPRADLHLANNYSINDEKL